MSEKVMSSEKSQKVCEDLYQACRGKYKLSFSQTSFLLKWFKACNQESFGFPGEEPVMKQMDMAIKLIKDITLEWQDKVRSNSTSLSLYNYFYARANAEGLKLPEDFVEKLSQKGEKE